MTEPTDLPSDRADDPASDGPGLTPEQERDVRRMLADARHAEPVPGDVAARLDRVLAELAAGEHDSPAPATVVDLASHRRRRVATLLVAAAAVVAVGIGLGQVMPGMSGSDSTATSAESGAGDVPAGAGSASSLRKEAGGSSDQTGPEAASGSTPTYALPAPRKLSEQDFSTEVRRLRTRALALDAILDDPLAYSSGALDSAAAASGELDATSRFACTPADWGAGVFVPVVYDGDPGVLVFRRARGDTQVVDLYGCGSAVVLRSTTLPAP